MRTNRQQMETKEFRAPRETSDDSPEPTPESVAQLRAEAAKENKAES
jgi:hypothetical protein